VSKLLHIFQVALLIQSAIFLSSNFSWAQKNPLELIEGSEDIRLDGKSSTYIVRGNVRLVKEGAKMYCDSAYYHTKTRSVRAYGKVHINKDDSLNMYCDSLFYDLDKEFAKLWGNVRVRDLEYKLVTDSLDFYGKENKGVYRKQGVITSIVSPEKLTSEVGYFYTDINHFFFRGDVVYTNEEYKITTDTLKYNGQQKIAHFFGPTDVSGPDGLMYCEKGWYNMQEEEGVFQQNAFIDRENQYIEGDSLYYNGKDGFYLAKDNVLIRDTSKQIEFTGGFAKSFENDRYGFITDHALAKNYDENGDTLYLHADSLFNYLDTLNDTRLILAYKDVKIFKLDMQGVCDSLSYQRETGEMNMYYEPILWAKNAQLSADSMTVFEKENDIKRAFLRLNALIVTEVDTGKYYNQITGKTLNAYFDSTQIRRVDIDGNAQTVYFMEDEKEEDSIIAVERSGMNRIYSSNISLFFEQGDIYAATYREEPDGKMHPMDQIESKEEKVDGFKWDNSRRPISWYTMIMTKEERKIWEKHQQELKRWLQPSSLVKENDLTEQEIIRADQWITTYNQQNHNYLTDSIFDSSDSLVPFDLSEDLKNKGEFISATANEMISDVQRIQFEIVGDSALLDSIFSSEELMQHAAKYQNTTDFKGGTENSLLLNQFIEDLDDWVDSLYKVLDTNVVRKDIQLYLKKKSLEQSENRTKQHRKDTLGVVENFSDSLNSKSDSLDYVLQSELVLQEDTLMIDSLMQDSVSIRNAAMADSSEGSFKTLRVSMMNKNIFLLERLFQEVKSGLIDRTVVQNKYEYLLFLERLKIDVKNMQRLALLYCVEELQQRILNRSIAAEKVQKTKKETEVVEDDQQAPSSEMDSE